MSDMRSWRKAIDEMFSDEFHPGAANRPADSEYELCPVCNFEDPDCEYCGGEGLIDRTGEHKIPDFSKMQMEGSVTERNDHASIKLKPEDLSDPDDDGMVERPESAKNVDDNLKAVAKRYGVEFVKDFKNYSKKNVKESQETQTTEVSENTMDKDMKEMLRLAGMYVAPAVYEQNESGDESPLTNTKDSIDRLAKELQKDKDKKDNKFKNQDGDLSVLSEGDEQEWIDAVNSAMEYIDAEHEVAYDVAAENGQMFDNVRHMSWFIDEVASKLMELGMVGTSPNEGMVDNDMFGSFEDDDFEDDLEEAFGDVDEDALFKPEEAPEYDDEREEEEFEGECGMREEGDGQTCSVVSLYDNERVYYALADKFGTELDFGDSDYQVMVPGGPDEVNAYLAGFGFEPGADYEVESHVEEDLNNGYHDQRTHDADDFFPTGATSNATKDRGPAGAKHGDNPMSTRTRVKENRAVYESMRQAYRRHRLK